MDKKYADEIFQLSIDGQRIENRKWEIRKDLGQMMKTGPLTWDEVAALAMKFKMEEQNVNA